MADLVFKRKRRAIRTSGGDVAIKVDAMTYNMIVDVADETGCPIKKVASEMIKHAYGQVVYEEE